MLAAGGGWDPSFLTGFNCDTSAGRAVDEVKEAEKTVFPGAHEMIEDFAQAFFSALSISGSIISHDPPASTTS